MHDARFDPKIFFKIDNFSPIATACRPKFVALEPISHQPEAQTGHRRGSNLVVLSAAELAKMTKRAC